MHENYYRILQVDPEADQDVIAAAYKALTGKLDPLHDLTGVHEVRMAELNRAYQALGDPARRRSYDSLRQADALVAMGPGDAHDGYVRESGAIYDPIAVSERAAGNGHAYDGGNLSDRIRQRQDVDTLTRMKIDFGRYAGWTLGEVIRHDPDYLQWLSRHSSGIRYRSAILRLFAERDGTRQTLHVPNDR